MSDEGIYHPDGTVTVWAPRLIARLEEAGCRPLKRLQNGHAIFGRTSTVRHLIAEYAASPRGRRPRPRHQ
jgi:hypothetical protein